MPDLAFLSDQRFEWTDEHGSAAGVRCVHQPVGSEKHYQKVSGMRSLSNSLVTVLTPVLATAMLAFANIRVVILFDLITFAAAFVALLRFVKIPQVEKQSGIESETILQSAKSGLRYLRDNRGILDLILFLAVINFTASIFNAALPAPKSRVNVICNCLLFP